MENKSIKSLSLQVLSALSLGLIMIGNIITINKINKGYEHSEQLSTEIKELRTANKQLSIAHDYKLSDLNTKLELQERLVRCLTKQTNGAIATQRTIQANTGGLLYKVDFLNIENMQKLQKSSEIAGRLYLSEENYSSKEWSDCYDLIYKNVKQETL